MKGRKERKEEKVGRREGGRGEGWETGRKEGGRKKENTGGGK